jgi:hypothetical protein
MLGSCQTNPIQSKTEVLDTASVTKFLQANPKFLSNYLKYYGRNNFCCVVGSPGFTPGPISSDTVKAMFEFYDQNEGYQVPIHNPDPNHKFEYLRGFIMPKESFDLIIKDKNIKTLSFYFGMKNYKEFNGDDDHDMKVNPRQTLMIIPVYDLSKVASNYPAGYDFVDPCPGTKGCPLPPK